MKPILSGILLLALFAVTFVGCDSPNNPDVPPQPYRWAMTVSIPGEAKDVSVQDGYAGVAASSYGAVVYDVRDLGNITQVFHDTLQHYYNPTAGASKIAIDAQHHVVCWLTEPRYSGATSIDYMTGGPGPAISIQGPVYGLCMESEPNTITYWFTSHSRVLDGGQTCRDSDTSAWDPNFCNFTFQADSIHLPSSGWTGSDRGQGFSHSKRNHLWAVAVEETGVHFVDDSTGAVRSIQIVPGSAFDCAWYQDSLLVVACDFEMVIMNVQDAAHPQIISQYTIPNSNRMRGVAIDGNWACIVDGYDGIYIVDIRDPRHPEKVQLLPLTHPTSVCVDNGRLYATDDLSGLVIYTH
ncbi:MAG TPA: hypothetical protein VGL38_04795 [bacterium]